MFKQWMKIAVILAALLAFGISFVSSASAGVLTPEKESTVTVTTTEHGQKHINGFAVKRYIIVSYTKANGLSKQEEESAEECRWIGKGTDVPVYTNSSGVPGTPGFFEFKDERHVWACKINGQWFKALCGNYLWLEVKPEIYEGMVFEVKSFAKSKFRIHVPIRLKLNLKCGYSYGKVVVDQWVSLKQLVKVKGSNVKSLKVTSVMRQHVKDYVKTHLSLGAQCGTTEKTTEKVSTCTCSTSTPPPHEGETPCSKCKEEEHPCGCTPPPHECEHGSVWSETEHKCVKNGYETPPPPVEAPGKNPEDEGEVGSNMCYSEITGEPVPEQPGGGCPPNSYGG